MTYPHGIVASTTNGCPVYLCECGRQQAAAPERRGRGLAVEEAQKIGWRRQPDGSWLCPYCTGMATADQPAWSSEDFEPVEEHGGEG